MRERRPAGRERPKHFGHGPTRHAAAEQRVDGRDVGAEAAARLVERWTTSDGGTMRVYTHEPDTSWWRRFKADAIGLLPIHSILWLALNDIREATGD